MLIQREGLVLFINKLELFKDGAPLRTLNFSSGLNLIIDETVDEHEGDTGNSVGKTTVLRLIDYCLGSKSQSIYRDPDSKKDIVPIKSFLEKHRVLVRLTLSEESDKIDDASKYVIERNFIKSGSAKVQRADGVDIPKATDLPKQVGEDLFAFPVDQKPSFRQLVSRCFRVDPPAVDHTMRYLPGTQSDTVYETLYLFMFGVPQVDRTTLIDKLRQEKRFRKKVELRPLNQLQQEQHRLNVQIEEAKVKRQSLNVDKNYEKNLTLLDNYRYQESQLQGQLSNLKLRKKLILDSQKQIQSSKLLIDLPELHALYDEAAEFVGTMDTAFDELVEYHNKMIETRVEFIGQEIPDLEREIVRLNSDSSVLSTKRNAMVNTLKRSNTTAELEKISEEIGTLYLQKGRIDERLSRVETSSDIIRKIETQLKKIDQSAFSDERLDLVTKHTNEFSDYFRAMSKKLYNEDYGVSVEIRTSATTGNRFYNFEPFPFESNNSSSGKKQGEIAAFDLAYIEYARKNNIPVMGFGLYDKKELMDNRQLLKIAQEAKDDDIQVIVPMLKDKLDPELESLGHIVVRLSQSDKLFRF